MERATLVMTRDEAAHWLRAWRDTSRPLRRRLGLHGEKASYHASIVMYNPRIVTVRGSRRKAKCNRPKYYESPSSV